ncbi:uncharacterized protein CPUR_08300 [Claviceps purpurea 20.1]|uniref:Uncharacterized protein n=1 Tax=Claviceps purpurea (strain 20.1) TaxID=1111077 RepID=M1WG98_CLAP2|nr:uncharacterized protein CPUR_08300 [Claviceps purpurea 20.1]
MNAVVKRLDLVQNLGAMRVLCSDKTGTLTKDKITICHYIDYTGETNTDVLKLVTVDSVFQGSNGNNIDGAIIEHHIADGRSINTAQYEKEAPRTNLLIVKGAFEEVLRLCFTVRQGGVAVPLEFQKKQMLVTRTNRLNQEGFRILFVAEKDIGKVDLREEDSLQELETNMVREPSASLTRPKDDAAQSIVELKDLGVQTEVLTGDTLPVAVNVCQHLELVSCFVTENDDVQAITGPELTKRPPSQAVFASQATVWACSAIASTTAWQDDEMTESSPVMAADAVGAVSVFAKWYNFFFARHVFLTLLWNGHLVFPSLAWQPRDSHHAQLRTWQAWC